MLIRWIADITMKFFLYFRTAASAIAMIRFSHALLWGWWHLYFVSIYQYSAHGQRSMTLHMALYLKLAVIIYIVFDVGGSSIIWICLTSVEILLVETSCSFYSTSNHRENEPQLWNWDKLGTMLASRQTWIKYNYSSVKESEPDSIIKTELKMRWASVL